MSYINKEDLLATINEVWERKYARCEWKTLYDLYRMCIRRINRAQVADVVQIVRCKDCKYFILGVCRHDLAMNLSRDDDFCSYGERRKEDDKIY